MNAIYDKSGKWRAKFHTCSQADYDEEKGFVTHFGTYWIIERFNGKSWDTQDIIGLDETPRIVFQDEAKVRMEELIQQTEAGERKIKKDCDCLSPCGVGEVESSWAHRFPRLGR